jgi:bifunctional non-homologous end joining protein LigD
MGRAPATKAPSAEIITIDGHQVRVTNPDKLYFSREAQVSKLDLVRYYLSIAPGALAGIRNRPIVLKRFVDGAEQPAFYQKRAPTDHPDWIRTISSRRSNRIRFGLSNPARAAL